MDIFIPDMYQKSIYTINYEKLYEDGMRCLLFDLDNTCVPYVEKKPTKKLKDLFDGLKEMGFKVIIFSNASKKRLEPFKNELVVDCYYSSRKPSKRKFLKVLKMFGFDLSETAIIGDQLFTDIKAANRAGVQAFLVKPVGNKSTLFIKIKRKFERKILK